GANRRSIRLDQALEGLDATLHRAGGAPEVLEHSFIVFREVPRGAVLRDVVEDHPRKDDEERDNGHKAKAHSHDRFGLHYAPSPSPEALRRTGAGAGEPPPRRRLISASSFSIDSSAASSWNCASSERSPTLIRSA